MSKLVVNSYTLIRVLPIKDKEVYNTIKHFSEVKDIIMTYGEYDLVIRVESPSLDNLDEFIFNKLRKIDGVTATTTLLEAKPKL
ncbi:Lrp/AsnC ligand binding domain-containing protein [Candidatus Bathyarchaeota archaeon]|nr:Lrp/AsnC ligand binding domain-containing protein [Candidatus Bathyarchaeota archaeon]